jgi:hypothetical protein
LVRAKGVDGNFCRAIIPSVRDLFGARQEKKRNAGGEEEPHRGPRVSPSPPATPTPLPFPLNRRKTCPLVRPPLGIGKRAFPWKRRCKHSTNRLARHTHSGAQARLDMRGCEGGTPSRLRRGRLRGRERGWWGVRGGGGRKTLGLYGLSPASPCIAFVFRISSRAENARGPESRFVGR